MDELKPIFGDWKIQMASWWILLLARYFGKPVCVIDGMWETTGYQWRGKIYITRMREVPYDQG